MAEKDNTIRDLVLVAVVGGVGIYAARSLMKSSMPPAPPVVVPPLPQIQMPGPQAPPIIVMPNLPGPGGAGEPLLPPTAPPTTPEDPTVPEPPVKLPLPQNVPDLKSPEGEWWSRTLNLSGANGGVLQHVEKWHTEYDKRRSENPDRPGKLWGAYYGLTSSPAAKKLGDKIF